MQKNIFVQSFVQRSDSIMQEHGMQVFRYRQCHQFRCVDGTMFVDAVIMAYRSCVFHRQQSIITVKTARIANTAMATNAILVSFSGVIAFPP